MSLVKVSEHLWVPEDFETNHDYFADADGAKRYTGVTTVLSVIAKPALVQWSANEAIKFVERCVSEGKELTPELLKEARYAHTKKKESAGTHGTDLHKLVENFVKECIEKYEGKPLAEAPKEIKKFSEWALSDVGRFLFSERRMASVELFVAGTADLAFIGKDGKKYMADFKTSSGIYGLDYFLQAAAYRALAESEGDDPYDGSCVVRLGKDGSFEAPYRYDYETDRAGFLHALGLYRALATFKK